MHSPTPTPLSAAEVAALRSEFPYFTAAAAATTPTAPSTDTAAPPAGKQPPAYLDAAATSQRPACVLDAERSFLIHQNAAVHRGTSQAVGTATEAFEHARTRVAAFVGAANPEQIVWAAGATDALNMIALGIGEANAGLSGGSNRFLLEAGDEILVTEAEHHANLIPWQRLAVKTGASLKYIPVDEHGIWSLDAARTALNSRTRIFAFGHVSNTTGYLAPVAELVEMARELGVITVLDACQSVPHLLVDFESLGVDFAVFSGHKMLGPNGIGVLYGRADMLANLPPARTGGSAITRVTMDAAEFLPPPHRFEAGTQAVSQVIGLGAAADYLMNIGMARIAAREHELVDRLVAGILDTPGLRLLGPQHTRDRVALAAIAVQGLHAHDVGQFLDAEGVLVRVGHHCTQPLHRALGLASSTRASVHLTTTEEEIDRFLDGLRGAQRYFQAEEAR